MASITTAIKNKLNRMNRAAQDAELGKRVNLYKYSVTVTRAMMTDGGSTSGTYTVTEKIPAGATFLYSAVTAVTGFTGDTSAVLIIGDGTDTDRYNTGTPSVFATSSTGISVGAPSGTTYHTAEKSPVITITSGTDFTAVAAGSITITFYYLD